jgi:hypothetical protein
MGMTSILTENRLHSTQTSMARTASKARHKVVERSPPFSRPVWPALIPVVRRTLVKTKSWKVSDKDQAEQRKSPAKSPNLAEKADRLLEAVEQREPEDDGSYFAACGGVTSSALVRSGSNYRRPAVSDE